MKVRHQQQVVLDTNVLLFDGMAITKFKKADIHIPFSVIEEIDRFKRDLGENGRNARQFSRFIDVLRAQGSLSGGVKLEKTDSYIYVNADQHHIKEKGLSWDNKADNRILAMALHLQETQAQKNVTLITKDINLRIKADVLGVNSKDFESEETNFDDPYSGIIEIEVPKETIDEFYKNKFLKIDKKVLPNQYVVLKDVQSESHAALARYKLEEEQLVPLLAASESIWGIHPRNMEQTFAFDCLLNDKIKCVSLVGKAGTGKTLLALAAGLYKTLDEGIFQRLLVSRPIFPMGRDIGYLPGDIEQKLNPWMQPIFDNVEFLLGSDKKASGRVQELLHQGMLNIEPLTYIRGRSIPNQFLIVDEAQNLTPHEIKTIITRAGSGTKVVLTGDPYQIDNPYVDSANSGLTYSVERFKDQNLSAHVSLVKGERSELAELAANIL